MRFFGQCSRRKRNCRQGQTNPRRSLSNWTGRPSLHRDFLYSAVFFAAASGGIQPCIERSRSGNGAHVWIFFREAVPAIKARKLGFAILREAMNHSGRMELNSYDRFLPNQDFLPKGGYGNLIALPLQGGARRSGNSVFVDNDFIAYDDQWQFLSSIQKLSQEDIDKQICSHICELELSTSSEDKPWITPKPMSSIPPLRM